MPENIKEKTKNSFFINDKIPVPWQSVPVFTDEGAFFNVIEENEKKIYLNDLCPYCGITINKDEISVRWMLDSDNANMIGPRIFSDNMPFHINCMKQARIFCPHMQKTIDSEFQCGIYKDLKKISHVWMKGILSKKNTPKGI